jgi:hypothetical protein
VSKELVAIQDATLQDTTTMPLVGYPYPKSSKPIFCISLLAHNIPFKFTSLTASCLLQQGLPDILFD